MFTSIVRYLTSSYKSTYKRESLKNDSPKYEVSHSL